MATSRKRGNKWEFVVRRKKILPKPIYLTFDDKEEGDKYCAQLESVLDMGIIPEGFAQQTKGSVSLSRAISEYQKSVSIKKDDERLLNTIGVELGAAKLSSINYAWVENWLHAMKREKNIAPSTIRHYVGALARCIDWCVRKDMIGANPLRMLPKGYASYTDEDGKYVEKREDISRDRRLEPGEDEKIRAAITDADMLLMFELAVETGMRMSEIYTLERSQVDYKKKTIFLDRTKNGNKRQVPLSSVAIAALKKHKHKGKHLFPWRDAREKVTAKLSRRWARLFESVGCEGLTFHCLRHEATSRLFERTNLTDLQIASITGHSDPRILKRYANLRGSDLAEQLW